MIASSSRVAQGQVRSLSAELPYLCETSFDGFGPLHLLSDDSLGYAFQTPLPCAITDPNAEESISSTIAAMLRALAPGTYWQWFVRSDSCVSRQLVQALGLEQCRGESREFADAFAGRWQSAERDGFFPEAPEINFHPRRVTVLVALKSQVLGSTQSFPSLSLALHRLSGKSKDSGATARAADFIRCCREVEGAALAQGWTTQPVDGDSLADWVGLEIFPQRADRGGSLRVGLGETRHAIASLGSIEGLCGEGFCSHARGTPVHHRVVSMLWPPPAVAPGLLNDLPFARPRITVCITARALPPASALAALKARALIEDRSTHRFNRTEMQARAEALQEVEHRIFSDGERIFDARLQVHVMEEDALAAEEAVVQVCNLLEQREFEASKESDIGSTLLLRACLPFAIYPETEDRLRRRRRLLSRDLADLHPGGGPGAGGSFGAFEARGRHHAIAYCSPGGEPLFLDPTRAEKNPHALVIGQSGSGKSFFVHDFLLHLWRREGVRLFLLSIKPDYRKLALLLGRYVELHLDSEESLNPFGGRPGLENQARWLAALRLMLSEAGSATAISREADITLQEAAMSAARRNWDELRNQAIRETLLEDICVELERSFGSLGRQLAFSLHPYRRGPFHRLFNRPRSVSADDRFVFFNLGSILRQPCAPLASFCVFLLVDEVIANPALRAVPKGLIADEVWALVRDEQAAAILERSLKAYRSLGGFALPIVQDPRDLDNPAGRVMLVNTATKVVLPLDPSGQADLDRYLRLNEREREVVRDLRLVKRRYSEFFVSVDGLASAKGLLVPDPLRYAVSTTDPIDEDRIERFYRESGQMMEAVRRFSREFPYGIDIARARG